MGCVDKWRSRMQGEWFLKSVGWTGNRCRSCPILFYFIIRTGGYPYPNSPPPKSLWGGGGESLTSSGQLGFGPAEPLGTPTENSENFQILNSNTIILVPIFNDKVPFNDKSPKL